MTTAVAYNPYDPVQQSFLSALQQGETGGAAHPFETGYGGANLSNTPTNQYGFPEWSGVGNTHAAGAYQFQPGTWDTVAAQHGLNFQNPQDQSAAAWYVAQQDYAAKNNGASLETALQNGQYSSVQNAISNIWPSVGGNAAAPQGLASDLASGGGSAASAASGAGLSTSTFGALLSGLTGSAGGSPGSGSKSGSNSSWLQNIFTRTGLIILGGVVILVALLYLLDKQGSLKHVGSLVEG